jgi:hypothetical protein
MGFWNTVGKITSVLVEEGIKKHQVLQKEANKRVREYERRIVNAERSNKMVDPEYARRVKEAKGKLKQFSENNLTNSSVPINSEVGNVALKEIANPLRYLNQPGVYILKIDGRIMKVGSAMIGVQKRMQQYYGMNQHCGLYHINENNRDNIQVIFQHCPYDKCSELESKLFDKYGGVESMPWAVRRPHHNIDTYHLKI